MLTTEEDDDAAGWSCSAYLQQLAAEEARHIELKN